MPQTPPSQETRAGVAERWIASQASTPATTSQNTKSSSSVENSPKLTSSSSSSWANKIPPPFASLGPPAASPPAAATPFFSFSSPMGDTSSSMGSLSGHHPPYGHSATTSTSFSSPSPPTAGELPHLSLPSKSPRACLVCFRNSEGTKPFLSYSLQNCHGYEPNDLAFSKDERLGFVAQPKWLKFWDHVCHP